MSSDTAGPRVLHPTRIVRRRAATFAVAALLTAATVPMATTASAAEGDAPEVIADTDHQQVVDLTFPFTEDVPVRYRDDYDASRSGGRHHQSTDLMVPLGTPVHAAVGGTVRWQSGDAEHGPPSYGWMLRIRGDDGRTYAYVHLGEQDRPWDEAYAPGVVPGARIERGQLLGWAGCSGSAACGGGEHLHFEIHDDDVVDPYSYHDHERINPHPSLVAAEERGDYPYDGPFRDVGASHTHAPTIEVLAEAGITRGCGQNRFCPAEPVSRQQMATFLVNALELAAPEQPREFTDVAGDNVHAANIAALAAAGITRGCGPDSFCPDDAVTRAQMATFLTAALGLEAAVPGRFSDVAGDNVHAANIAALAAAGITRGCGPDSFCPDDAVTRAQMATFLVQALDL